MTEDKKTQKTLVFKMHKASCIVLAAAIAIGVLLIVSPAFASSSNPCGSCHAGYSQTLDVLEGNGAIPTSLQVGQTTAVSVVVENKVNAAKYTALSGVSLTLGSQSGRFSVSTPTISVGVLNKGTTTVTWQIIGTSAGSDAIVITAAGKNTHMNLSFQDNYNPNPAITITAPPAPTPISTPVPTAPPTPVPTAPPTPVPTAPPTPVPVATVTPAPTAAPTIVPTSIPTIVPTSTPAPVLASTPTPTPIPTINPTPTLSSAATATPITTPTATQTSTPSTIPPSTQKTTATQTPTIPSTTNPMPTSTATSTPTTTPTLEPSQSPETCPLQISQENPQSDSELEFQSKALFYGSWRSNWPYAYKNSQLLDNPQYNNYTTEEKTSAEPTTNVSDAWTFPILFASPIMIPFAALAIYFGRKMLMIDQRSRNQKVGRS
jgi:hypothetical protein